MIVLTKIRYNQQIRVGTQPDMESICEFSFRMRIAGRIEQASQSRYNNTTPLCVPYLFREDYCDAFGQLMSYRKWKDLHRTYCQLTVCNLRTLLKRKWHLFLNLSPIPKITQTFKTQQSITTPLRYMFVGENGSLSKLGNKLRKIL